MKIDVNETKLSNRSKFKQVDYLIEEELKKGLLGAGSCHKKWARKKALLKELYNIDWKTPAELNPQIIFE